MLMKCMNILRVAQRRVQFVNLFSFSSNYQPPSIDKLPLSVFQKRCLKGVLVDKSKLISEIQNCEEGAVITRPRRWGKTFNLQMLEAFYGYTENVSVQNFNKSLFLGGDVTLKKKEYRLDAQVISEYNDICEEHQGQYPIIYITLSDVNNNSEEEVLKSLYKSMAEAYEKHIHLFNRILLDEMSEFTQEQKEAIDYSNLHTKDYSVIYDNWEKYVKPNSKHAPWIKIADYFLTPTPSPTPNEGNITDSILNLSQILTKYYQKPTCMLLMDEYDLPFNNMITKSIQSGNNTDSPNYLQTTLNRMFLNGVKNKLKVHKTIIMGIMPLALSQMSTGWNDLQQYTVATGQLETCFGYTEEEVSKQVQNLPMYSEVEKDDLRISIQRYYNGYRIGKSKLYNPYSVYSCLQLLLQQKIGKDGLQKYWTEIGSVFYLEDLLKRLSQDEMAGIVENEHNEYDFTNKALTIQDLMAGKSIDELMSTLLHLGYLTFSDSNKLIVPNEEMKSAFIRVIYPKYLKRYGESYLETWEELDKSLQNTQDYINKIRCKVLPLINKQFADSKNKDLSEGYFRGILSAYPLTTKPQFIRIKEQTSENKRIDIVYLPHSGNGNSLIIHELKVNQISRNKSEANEETLEDAWWQILGNLYPSDGLRDYPTAEQLIIRVLLFAKEKTPEGYTFDGSGYHFNIAEANQLLEHFQTYDETKRRMLVKGSPEVNTNERKAARNEFLEHCKAESLFKLLEKYHTQQS